jgi:uncharacterized protein YjiS (DUF1127 family)
LSLRIREEELIELIRSIDFPVRASGVTEQSQCDAIVAIADCRRIVMATHTSNSLLQVHDMPSGSARGLLGSSFNAVRSVGRAVVRWYRERRDIVELERMDDRLLADIGITRGEAQHMVRNGRWHQASSEPADAFPVTDRRLFSVLMWDKEAGERA